mgnify:CR=1 FL=1
MPLSALPKVLLAKSEVTYKTDSVPTGATNAILIREEPTLTPIDMETDERSNCKAFFGHNQVLVAAVRRKLSYEVEFGGAGSPLGVAAAYSPLLKGCAMNQVIVATTSVAHSPITAVTDSVTKYFWIGDKKYILVGARGNAKWKFTAGKIPLMMFDFWGLLPAASDVVDDSGNGGALTLTAWKQPQPINFANTTAFSVHAFGSTELYSMEIDLGNMVTPRNKPNAEDIVITGRKPTVTLSIGEPTLAQKNYYTNQKGAILDVLSITHGVGAGNIINGAAPKMQIESIDLGSEDNVRTLNIKGRLLPNAGNDEIVWTLT